MEKPPSDTRNSPPPLPPMLPISTRSVSKAPPPLPPQHGFSTVEKTARPFLKAFACGGVLYVFIVGMILHGGGPNVDYRCGYALTGCLVATVVSGLWCRNDTHKWSWARMIATVLGFYLAFGFVETLGSRQE